jgi:hypothetical protein
MDDNGTHIEQYPSRIRFTFTVIGENAFFLKCFADFLADGFNLAVAISATDNKIVGEGANLSGIQDNNIFSQFIRSRFDYLPGYFYRFQNELPLLSLTLCSEINYTTFPDIRLIMTRQSLTPAPSYLL